MCHNDWHIVEAQVISEFITKHHTTPNTRHGNNYSLNDSI